MKLTYLEVDHSRSPYDALTENQREEFHERLVTSLLYHDHALEGVSLTPNEIERALDGKPCRNYCDEQTKKSLCRLKQGLHQVKREARSGREITVEWIRDLHRHMCDPEEEAAGRYRQRDTSPGVYNLDIVKANSISYHFHRFVQKCNGEFQELHPVRRAAIAHWKFMRAFPFDEKTGIVGRLLMNFMLWKSDYPAATIHAMDRHHYFQALRGHEADMVPVLVDGIKATISAAEDFADESEADEGLLGTDRVSSGNGADIGRPAV